MITHDPNAVFREMSEDDLADLALAMKESISTARDTLYRCEDELRRRLTDNNAKRLQGTRFLVKSTLRREIKWDQDRLLSAALVAASAGRMVAGLFDEAFPLKRECRVAKLNELLKFGGKTAEAIEAAKAEVKETTLLEYEAL